MNQRARGALSMTGVLTVAGGIAVGAALLPEQIGVRPISSTLSSALPASVTIPTLACPGPETLVVPKGGKAVSPEAGVLVSALVAAHGSADATLKAEGPASATIKAISGNSPKSEVPAHAGTELDLATGSGRPSVRSLSTWNLGPLVLTGRNRSHDAGAELAGVQSTITTKGDLRGLSASRCDPTSAEAWLVGGGTLAGQRLRLVLSNPTASTATVDVTVLSEDGRVDAPSGEGVVVPAGGQTPLFIDALAPGHEQIAVHVVARSGQVVARMHESVLRGLTPGGVDVVSPSAEPAKHQLIPGVSLVNGYSKTAADPSAPGSTSIRVAVPGSEEAVVKVRLLTSSGAVALPVSTVLNVPAGKVVDIPVSGIASGTYAAEVEADVPVIAGAQVGRPPAPGHKVVEFAWAPAVPALSGGGYTVLPPGTRSTVSLVAAGKGGSVKITPVDADGKDLDPVEVKMKDGTAAAFALDQAAAAFRIPQPDGGPVAASVVSTSTADDFGTAITVLGVEPAQSDAAPANAVADTRVGLK